MKKRFYSEMSSGSKTLERVDSSSKKRTSLYKTKRWQFTLAMSMIATAGFLCFTSTAVFAKNSAHLDNHSRTEQIWGSGKENNQVLRRLP